MQPQGSLPVAGGDAVFDCRTCGACCSYSAEWPRFSLEGDAALALIPPDYVDDPRGRMRGDGNRCSALVGEVGAQTACAVYAVRPEVCRACEPGDEACRMARRRFGL
jgi:Fe-S-cluster containining protein